MSHHFAHDLAAKALENSESSRTVRTRPQDDNSEATRRPSEAISSPGDRTRQVGNITIVFHYDESVNIYCNHCDEDITTIIKLFNHDCSD